ncbi:MAG: two-component regulator propeller domain-containing protein [Sphingobacteriales bacterium]
MKKLILFLLLALSLNTFAQNRDLYFEHLNVVQGLPESMITACHQDRLGYMWIGTQNGLVRYDGYKVKVYKLGLGIKGSLKDYAADDIYEAKDGRLWISTRGNGLFSYNRATDKFEQYSFYGQYSGFSHRSIIIDDDGYLWFSIQRLARILAPARLPVARRNIKNRRQEQFPDSATAIISSKTGVVWLATTKGLVYFDRSTGKMSKAFSPSSFSRKQYIINLYEAPSAPGILWFDIVDDRFNPLGLFSFNTATHLFKNYPANAHIPGAIASADIYCIHEDDQRRLWFGTPGWLCLFDPLSATFKNYAAPAPLPGTRATTISNIAQQPDGKLWLSTFAFPDGSNGLLLFDPSNGAFKRYAHDERKPYSLNINRVILPLVDRTGMVWAGMAWGGIDRVNSLRSQFESYLPGGGDNTGYPAGGSQGVAQSADGYCWLGTHEGLVRWKTNTAIFDRISLPAYIKKDGLRVFATDNEGLIWCESAGNTLFTYNPKTAGVDTLAYPGKWSQVDISIVYPDRAGLIWIGTNGSGLYSYNKQTHKFTAYPYEKSSDGIRYNGRKLDNGQVRSIYEDKQGVLWVGTNLGGLNRFNKKDRTFTSFFDMTKGLSCVIQMREDAAGRFWVGTYLSGLFLFDRKTGQSKQFTARDGLLDDDVSGMQEDALGNIWISCERGFTKFDPLNNTYAYYTTNNALPFPFGEEALNSLIKTRENQLVLFSRNGVVAFYPGKLTKNPYPPQVQLEMLEHNDPQSSDAKITTENLYGKQQVELPHNQNRISFNYVALHFEDPAQNQYAYQLVGYDKNWVKAGTQRSVTYTNLSPATYTFRVKASNSDGVWNEKGASVIIIIHPPWWQTWWARLIFLFAVVGLVWAIVYYRSRSLVRAKHLLEQKVQLRTKEVLEQKEEIETQRDSLETTLEELKTTQGQLVQREKMASLGELTAGIAHEIQNPLNFVNNFSEVNREMIIELKDELKNGNLEEVLAIARDIQQNEEKINHHGKRADSIVKGMLEHSRAGTGEKQPTDINALADEYLRLSYHGLRAKDKEFNAELVTNFDPGLPNADVVPQDISRVLLNLFNNAFYAVNQKAKTAGNDYKPTVKVSTTQQNGSIIISVKDDGNGIPDAIKEKIMQPFFTTKPTGDGTGLGLSLSYDIIVKGHGGSITVDTKEGSFSEFTISLPVS